MNDLGKPERPGLFPRNSGSWCEEAPPLGSYPGYSASSATSPFPSKAWPENDVGQSTPISRKRRSCGTRQDVTATTISVMAPPNNTAGTAPNNFAATPDSNAPISFDEPMKIEFTADTRPIRCGGVNTCSNVERITTLTMSNSPLATRSATDSTNDRDR